jgi:hypothetical protein
MIEIDIEIYKLSGSISLVKKLVNTTFHLLPPFAGFTQNILSHFNMGSSSS